MKRYEQYGSLEIAVLLEQTIRCENCPVKSKCDTSEIDESCHEMLTEWLEEEI